MGDHCSQKISNHHEVCTSKSCVLHESPMNYRYIRTCIVAYISMFDHSFAKLSEAERSQWFRNLRLDITQPLSDNPGVRRCIPDIGKLLQSEAVRNSSSLIIV